MEKLSEDFQDLGNIIKGGWNTSSDISGATSNVITHPTTTAKIGAGVIGGLYLARKAKEAYDKHKASSSDNNVNTREELAELATDELVDLIDINEEQAKSLIMEAREIWFN